MSTAGVGESPATRAWPRTVLVVVALVLLAGLGWVLGPGAGWVLERVDGVAGLVGAQRAAALDAIRGRALTIVTGLAALVAVYYTARNVETSRRTYAIGQRTLALTEQGHVTERYTKAIEQLGSADLAVRLGGIYALERIARDSARDHPTVMEVLTAFVREPSDLAAAGAPSAGSTRSPHRPVPNQGRPRLRGDVQAAVTVIGRRDVDQDDAARRIDLAEANLVGADLPGARLAHVDLAQANLEWADLTNADLPRANLWNANLAHAKLVNANLRGAILDGAAVNGASFIGADLQDVDRDVVDFAGADIDS